MYTHKALMSLIKPTLDYKAPVAISQPHAVLSKI